MHRVTLASWHDGQAPGTVLEVDDAQLSALRHDGRVAASEAYDEGGFLEPTFVETTSGSEAAEPDAAPAEPEDQSAEAEPAAEDEQPKGRRRR